MRLLFLPPYICAAALLLLFFFTPADPAFSQSAGNPADSLLIQDPASLNGLPIGEIRCTGNKRTRDHILIQELLVRPGEPYDQELIEESERNLRSFSYLNSAEIVPHPRRDEGVVDLEIVVSDRFPYIIFPAPSFGGGRFDMNFVLAHMNFLGRGQGVGTQGHISSDEADTFLGWFIEPRLGGSRWYGAVAGGRQGDRGEQLGLEIERPLFALSTDWAFELRLYDWESEKQLYESGWQISQFYQREIGGSAKLTRSFRRDDRKLEAGVSYEYFDERNEQDTGWMGPIARDKRRGIVKMELSFEKFWFVEDTYLFRLGQVEDLKLGPRAGVLFGGALKALGSDRNYPQFGLTLGWFGGSPGHGYLEASMSTGIRIEDGDITNHTGGGSFGAYLRLGRADLISLRTRAAFQRRMEDPSQLLLGSGRGLRGYESQAFNGSRMLASSMEWRHMVIEHRRWALAAVLFTDAGCIWNGGQSIRDVPWLIGSGAGLRISFPGLIGGPILRFDIGYGFKADYVDFSFGE